MQTSTNVKMDKLTSVTRMLFAVTPKDHIVAIADKDSLAMDSTAHVSNKNSECKGFSCTSMMHFSNLFT